MALLPLMSAWFQAGHTLLHLLRGIWSPLLWCKQG